MSTEEKEIDPFQFGLDGRQESYFSAEELWGGMDLAAQAVKDAAVGGNFDLNPSLTSTVSQLTDAGA